MRLHGIVLSLDSLGYAYVPVDITGPNAVYQANLLIDTGAASTTLSTKLAPPLGFQLSSLKSEIVPVAGGQSPAWIAGMDGVAVGPLSLPHLSCRFMQMVTQFDGLLGNDLLRALRILLVLDVKGGTAKLVFRK